MKTISDNSDFDSQFERLLKEEPLFSLPDDFAEKVSASMGRKLIFRQLLLNYLRFAGGTTLVVIVSVLINFLISKYLPEIFHLNINLFGILPVGFGILFVLFIDRVILRYYEFKRL
ncbi:MAG: hypothetical protein Q8859_06665 [Bacteroidota bacterium]|nr:hypothetical protein [Bacteroidota bacterium]